MKRVAAVDPLPTPWLFEPAKCSDDRVDYCLDCHGASTMYSFLHLSGVDAGTVVRARLDEHSQRTWPGKNEEPDGKSEFRTRHLSIPSRTLCRCATLAGHHTWNQRLMLSTQPHRLVKFMSPQYDTDYKMVYFQPHYPSIWCIILIESFSISGNYYLMACYFCTKLPSPTTVVWKYRDEWRIKLVDEIGVFIFE